MFTNQNVFYRANFILRRFVDFTLFFVFFFFGIQKSFAEITEFKVPSLSGPVMDLGQMMDSGDIQKVDQVLRQYNEAGKAQIQVLTLPDLQGFPIEQASIKIVETWKLGTAKQDNGILFLVSSRERKLRIEVGQGLEGALPDAIASRIIREIVVPNFKAGRRSEGIVAGVVEIIRQVDKEYADKNLEAVAPSSQVTNSMSAVGQLLLLVIFIVFFIIKGGGGGGRRGGYYGGGWYGGGGSSSGGGSSGGSWGGGGGGFSGGGASGDW